MSGMGRKRPSLDQIARALNLCFPASIRLSSAPALRKRVNDGIPARSPWVKRPWAPALRFEGNEAAIAVG